jgi:hypothetical protein
MIKQLIRDQTLVDDSGKMTQRTVEWARQVTNLSIITGSGSPEGAIEAQITTLYMNTAGTAGNILYIKKLADTSGNRKNGWILV